MAQTPPTITASLAPTQANVQSYRKQPISSKLIAFQKSFEHVCCTSVPIFAISEVSVPNVSRPTTATAVPALGIAMQKTTSTTSCLTFRLTTSRRTTNEERSRQGLCTQLQALVRSPWAGQQHHRTSTPREQKVEIRAAAVPLLLAMCGV